MTFVTPSTRLRSDTRSPPLFNSRIEAFPWPVLDGLEQPEHLAFAEDLRSLAIEMG